MKNYFLLFIISFLFGYTANAQLDIKTFPIDQFKLPDIDRQALDLSGNFLGDFNTSVNNEANQSYTTSQFRPQLGLNYSRYINRADVQAYYGISTYPDLSLESTNNDFAEQKINSTTFRPEIHFSGQRAKYKGLHFTSIGASGNVNYYHYSETVKEAGLEDKAGAHDLDLGLFIPLGIGKGRVEVVSDMAMALFLLDDAVQSGVDGSLISNDQVNAFAARMATLRNERVFDTRVKRTYELKELYNFMKDNHWTLADDPGFFTVLTDNWLYNMNVSRLSGKKWTYSFIPSFELDNYKTTHNGEEPNLYNSNSLGGAFRIDFEKYKPVNIHRDIFRTHSLSVGVNTDINDSDFNEGQTESFHADFTTSIGRQWIPDSRTLVAASVQVYYSYTHPFEESGLFPQDDHQAGMSLIGRANYFISYRTRLFADFDMSYNYHRNGDYIFIHPYPYDLERVDTGFNVRLNGGITVSIF